MMLVISSVLLTINIILMCFLYFRIKKQFSPEAYKDLMQKRMNSILMDFNLQTDQAITILEDKMNELKNLILDADGRFNALSRKLQVIDEMKNIDRVVVNKESSEKTVKEFAQPVSKEIVEENKVVIYQGHEDLAKKDEFTRRRIVEMSKSGWANDYIAQKLSIPLAEVELILFMENH